MCIFQPLRTHRRQSVCSPSSQPMGKDISQCLEKIPGLNISRATFSHAGHGSVKSLGMVCDVKSYTDDNGISRALQQPARKLCSPHNKIQSEERRVGKEWSSTCSSPW